MLRITCPHCGCRDYVEFVYGGDAEQPFPDLADPDLGRWTDFVFIRGNPKGEHAEYWQHQSGCRQWLRVVRDTVTHEIRSVTPARERTPAGPMPAEETVAPASRAGARSVALGTSS